VITALIPADLYRDLDRLRKRRDLSWRGVARATGVSPSGLSRLAAGHMPDALNYVRLTSWMWTSMITDYYAVQA